MAESWVFGLLPVGQPSSSLRFRTKDAAATQHWPSLVKGARFHFWVVTDRASNDWLRFGCGSVFRGSNSFWIARHPGRTQEIPAQLFFWRSEWCNLLHSDDV